MFRVVCHEGVAIGHSYESDHHLVFFGTRHGNMETLQRHFPQLNFATIKQTHSIDWTAASSNAVAADAHFTHEPNLALLIKTADCLPIMIAGNSFAAAVHAGWRGLVGGIISGLVPALQSSHATAAFVGPHIGRHSFEVGREVEKEFARSLASASLSTNEIFLAHANPEKVYLNLALVARRQLHALGVKKILNCDYNTFSNLDYHSFRRDGDRAGRQLSFISLKAVAT
jgi:YfiH family protein